VGGGARVSTGSDSKQDYQTPGDLFHACETRFGHVVLDLAAHSENRKHERYFAPCTGPLGPLPFDSEAYAIDSFDQDWTAISEKFRNPEDGGPGLLWLNCEFNDIATWSKRCREEGERGASILLLTPASVGSNWFRRNIASAADVYLLNGRPSFIPGQTFNKDCIISLYGPRCDGSIHVWDWKNDQILESWNRVPKL
jgi:hypothetical protein